jgi:hypothetical protein
MTPERIALLKAISQLAERYPDWRLGQLVSNVAGWADTNLWDIDDEQLLAAATSHIEQFTSESPNSRIHVG